MKQDKIFLVIAGIIALATIATSPYAVLAAYEPQGDLTRCTTTVAPSALSAAACPGNTTTGKLDIKAGAFADAPTYSKCVQIDNATNKQYFIPLKTHREWIAFYNSATAPGSALGLTVRDCGVSCGNASGQASDTQPVTNLCTAPATASAVTNDGTNWNWTCTDGASTANCSAGMGGGGECVLKAGTLMGANPNYYQIDDVYGLQSEVPGCASRQFWRADYPDDRYLCTSDFSIVATDCGGNFKACGSANGSTVATVPAADTLCTSGSTLLSGFGLVNGNTYKWTCARNGALDYCSAIYDPPISAGCLVDTVAWDRWTPLTCDMSDAPTNCTGTNDISFSVGTMMNASYDMALFYSPSRYQVTWNGANCALQAGTNTATCQNVPNGNYTVNVSVQDTFTGQTDNFSLTARKMTIDSTAPGCNDLPP